MIFNIKIVPSTVHLVIAPTNRLKLTTSSGLVPAEMCWRSGPPSSSEAEKSPGTLETRVPWLDRPTDFLARYSGQKPTRQVHVKVILSVFTECGDGVLADTTCPALENIRSLHIDDLEILEYDFRVSDRQNAFHRFGSVQKSKCP